MTTITKRHLLMTAAAVLMLGAGTALAQHENHGQAPAKADQPKHEEKSEAATKADDRIGGPYSLDTCPITGKKLGAMGDPVVKLYDGREVRFCCPMCSPKFEKDMAASLAKIDEKIVKDQTPLYPLKTSVATGKDLPAKPFEFVYGNRLIRLGAESEKAEFLKEPKKHLATLDKAVVEQQGKDYALKTCPVSKEQFGGDMGKPVDLVIGGRLVRLCCKACNKDVEKDPAKFIAMVDAASKGKAETPNADHKKDGHDQKHKGG